MSRAYNFSPGPAMLPESVLLEAQGTMLEYGDAGASIVEISHRGPEFLDIASRAEADLRALVGIPDDYAVLFLPGGATAQQALLPLNFAAPGQRADYVLTGHWGATATRQARPGVEVLDPQHQPVALLLDHEQFIELRVRALDVAVGSHHGRPDRSHPVLLDVAIAECAGPLAGDERDLLNRGLCRRSGADGRFLCERRRGQRGAEHGGQHETGEGTNLHAPAMVQRTATRANAAAGQPIPGRTARAAPATARGRSPAPGSGSGAA